MRRWGERAIREAILSNCSGVKEGSACAGVAADGIASASETMDARKEANSLLPSTANRMRLPFQNSCIQPMCGASLQPSRSCFGFVQIPKVLTVLSSNAPSALFEPLKQRQHNDSQPTVILWDQALCGERAFCSSNQVCRVQATRQVSPSDLFTHRVLEEAS